MTLAHLTGADVGWITGTLAVAALVICAAKVAIDYFGDLTGWF